MRFDVLVASPRDLRKLPRSELSRPRLTSGRLCRLQWILVGSATVLSRRQQKMRVASGGAMTMDDAGEFHVTLFSALVRELGKSDKEWLALQLAEILAHRITADAELGRNRTVEDAAELAARFVGKITSERSTLPSRPRLVRHPKETRTPIPASLREDHEIVEAAKRAIRLKFDSWRAVKRGEHWYAGFARKMVEQHAGIVGQRIVERWARTWAMEARQGRSHAIANAPKRGGESNGPVATT